MYVSRICFPQCIQELCYRSLSHVLMNLEQILCPDIALLSSFSMSSLFLYLPEALGFMLTLKWNVWTTTYWKSSRIILVSISPECNLNAHTLACSHLLGGNLFPMDFQSGSNWTETMTS